MTNPETTQPLITPREAAQRLLEEATRQAVKTNGAAGLRPVRIDGRRMFRLSDVEGFIRWGGLAA